MRATQIGGPLSSSFSGPNPASPAGAGVTYGRVAAQTGRHSAHHNGVAARRDAIAERLPLRPWVSRQAVVPWPKRQLIASEQNPSLHTESPSLPPMDGSRRLAGHIMTGRDQRPPSRCAPRCGAGTGLADLLGPSQGADIGGSVTAGRGRRSTRHRTYGSGWQPDFRRRGLAGRCRRPWHARRWHDHHKATTGRQLRERAAQRPSPRQMSRQSRRQARAGMQSLTWPARLRDSLRGGNGTSGLGDSDQGIDADPLNSSSGLIAALALSVPLWAGGTYYAPNLRGISPPPTQKGPSMSAKRSYTLHITRPLSPNQGAIAWHPNWHPTSRDRVG